MAGIGQRPGIDFPAHPDMMGTSLFLVGLALTWTTLNGDTPSALGTWAAYGVGCSLAASLFADLRHGLRNLVRADLIGMLAIYGLLYAEFLFPQPQFDFENTRESISRGITFSMIGYAIYALVRHLGIKKKYPQAGLFVDPVSPSLLLRLFWFCFIIGFLHQWIAVDFNFSEWLGHWTGIRFSQPWSRTHLGDWNALLYELSLLLYVVSPLGAIILVRRHIYGNFQCSLVIVAVLLVVIHAFLGGTRHIFCSHLIMFAMGFMYFQKFSPKLIILTGLALLGIIYGTSNMMISFRQIGFKTYIEQRLEGHVFRTDEEALKVDFNLQTFSWMIDKMPREYDHLGMEVPYMAIVRPIPRALWKDKPLGMSTTIEEILFRPGTGGTWAVTYMGEAYMAYGILGIVVVSAGLGWLSSLWNSAGSPKNSDLGILIFASGFFSFAIAVRSLFTFTTAILPTLFLIFLGSYLLRNRASLMPSKRNTASGS